MTKSKSVPAGAAASVVDRSHFPSWLLAVLLVLATVLAYQPMWHAGFTWDDDLLLTANPLIKSSHGWYQFWITTKTPDYFPVMSSFFWVEWRLWGMNAIGYHIVNVLLHAVNAILLWQLLARLKIPGSRLAAAIFALHPVNAASVAWVAELKNTLSLFFFMLALLWYVEFDNTSRRRCYWLAFGAFLFALLSKIEVAPLPFVLLGIAWWRRGHVDWRDLQRSVPFFTAALVLGLVSVWFQDHVAIGSVVVRTDNFWSRLAGAGWAVWFYLGKTLLPMNLIPVYPRWQIDPANWLSYVPGLLLVAGFLFLWRHRKSWGKAWLFGLGYAVLMFLPVLGFLNISFFQFSLVANHWQYFPIIGPIALAAAGITMASGSLVKGYSWLKPAFCGALLLTLGVLTWGQSRLYADDEMLWRTTIDRNPASWLAHNNLAQSLLQKGQVNGAIMECRVALAINPDDALSHNNFAGALLQKGQVNEAILQCQKALAINPDNALAHDNLGTALLQKGQLGEAIIQFQKALAIQPDNVEAHNNLGAALAQKGQVDEAIVEFQRALVMQPDNADACDNLGSALFQKGRLDEAVIQFQKALVISPGLVLAQDKLANIAWILATSSDPSVRNGAKAIELAEQTDRLSGGTNPVMAATLAAAYAEAGRFSEAITNAQRALQLATRQNNAALISALEAQLKLYQAGSPFHQAASSR